MAGLIGFEERAARFFASQEAKKAAQKQSRENSTAQPERDYGDFSFEDPNETGTIDIRLNAGLEGVLAAFPDQFDMEKQTKLGGSIQENLKEIAARFYDLSEEETPNEFAAVLARLGAAGQEGSQEAEKIKENIGYLKECGIDKIVFPKKPMDLAAGGKYMEDLSCVAIAIADLIAIGITDLKKQGVESVFWPKNLDEFGQCTIHLDEYLKSTLALNDLKAKTDAYLDAKERLFEIYPDQKPGNYKRPTFFTTPWSQGKELSLKQFPAFIREKGEEIGRNTKIIEDGIQQEIERRKLEPQTPEQKEPSNFALSQTGAEALVDEGMEKLGGFALPVEMPREDLLKIYVALQTGPLRRAVRQLGEIRQGTEERAAFARAFLDSSPQKQEEIPLEYLPDPTGFFVPREDEKPEVEKLIAAETERLTKELRREEKISIPSRESQRTSNILSQGEIRALLTGTLPDKIEPEIPEDKIFRARGLKFDRNGKLMP